jgi:hypothetical protein
MPFESIPALDVKYGLISFDKDGQERSDDPDGGIFTRRILERIGTDKPSHVFLFSHGWKGDEPAAIDQYNRWIGAMVKLDGDRTAMGRGFRPLFLGLHWPSEPWGEEQISAPASFGTAETPVIDTLLEAAIQHFGGSAAVRGPLEVIFHAFEQNPAAKDLPDDVVAAYHALAEAIGFSAGSGADAPPDQEGAPLDPQRAIRAERNASLGASFGIFGAIKNGSLAGLRQTSFWLMKHRARTVGEQGMHQFVAQLQRNCDAQIHLMGHSFGCIVVSAILAGPGGNSPLPKLVNSIVLVQGALSLWSYANQVPDSSTPGYFRKVLSRVGGPIVTTQSVNDTAVGFAYPAAVWVVDEADFATAPVFPTFGGVGTYGIQGTSLLAPEPKLMLDEHGVYNFQAGRIYNLDGSQFIPSHTGIDGPQVARVIWQAALVQ